MNKNLLLSGFIFLTTASFAQQAMQTEHGYSTDVPSSFPREKVTTRATNISAWYNYGATLYNLGGAVNYYRNFLFPDSTVQVEFSSGFGYVWKHSIGHVLDPTSFQFDMNGEVSLIPGMPYSVDSIAIPYRYWRPQTTNPDTLVVQVYLQPDINLVANPGWTSGASYASVDYDYLNRVGAGETLTFTRLLTTADEINASQGFLYFAVNLNVPAGQKVAATATYLPGNPYNVNDTIDTYSSFTVTNQINAFVMYDYSDTDLQYEPNYYNNEVSATTEVRYNISTIGWNGQYIPGTAWFSGIYSGDIYFRLTYDQEVFGLNEAAAIHNLKLFPNPANDVLHFSADIAFAKADIMDISGKVIHTVQANQLNQVDVSMLSKGTYVIKLYGNAGEVVRQSFVKQ